MYSIFNTASLLYFTHVIDYLIPNFYEKSVLLSMEYWKYYYLYIGLDEELTIVFDTAFLDKSTIGLYLSFPRSIYISSRYCYHNLSVCNGINFNESYHLSIFVNTLFIIVSLFLVHNKLLYSSFFILYCSVVCFTCVQICHSCYNIHAILTCKRFGGDNEPKLYE